MQHEIVVVEQSLGSGGGEGDGTKADFLRAWGWSDLACYDIRALRGPAPFIT